MTPKCLGRGQIHPRQARFDPRKRGPAWKHLVLAGSARGLTSHPSVHSQSTSGPAPRDKRIHSGISRKTVLKLLDLVFICSRRIAIAGLKTCAERLDGIVFSAQSTGQPGYARYLEMLTSAPARLRPNCCRATDGSATRWTKRLIPSSINIAIFGEPCIAPGASEAELPRSRPMAEIRTIWIHVNGSTA